MGKHKFQREMFYDPDRERWILKSTRDDGASLQMTFQELPDKVHQIMHYELIEFKLIGIGGLDANKRTEGFSR